MRKEKGCYHIKHFHERSYALGYVAHHNIQLFSAEGYNGYAYNENCNLSFNVKLTCDNFFIFSFIA
jgi:hypothetical protein